MKRRLLLAVLAAAPLAVLAHHGWSEYDSTKLLKLTGKVVEAGYEHPHGYIRMETPGKTWLCVLAPPSRMENRGATAAVLPVGAMISAYGYPNRDDLNEIRAERITVDGKTVELR